MNNEIFYYDFLKRDWFKSKTIMCPEARRNFACANVG